MAVVTLAQAPATASAGATNTASAMLGSAPTIGNQLLCLVTYSAFSGSLSTPSGWTQVYNNVGVPSTSGANNALFQKTSAGSGDQTITVVTGNTFGMTLYFVELVNAGIATGFLQANSATSSVLTDSTAGDLVMFMGYANGGSAGGAATGWNETYVSETTGLACGDFQYYTRIPVTTTYQTTFTGALSTVIFSVPNMAPVSGNARITQEMIETLGMPATQNARITQQATEVLYTPLTTGTHARVTQMAIEVLFLPTSSIAPVLARRSDASFTYFPLRAAVSRV